VIIFFWFDNISDFSFSKKKKIKQLIYDYTKKCKRAQLSGI
jgi:hypothetical protein